MSYTTIKAIWPGEKHEDLQELRNGWGSGPVIWDAMCQKYLGARDGVIGKLWPLWKDQAIPEAHRAVLMMTYDRAYVTKKDYARAAADIRQFLQDFPPNDGRVNHWPALAALFETDPDIPAIGLHCTSVSEDPFQGPWNEEKEEYDPPDWEMCYDIYAEIDGEKVPVRSVRNSKS